MPQPNKPTLTMPGTAAENASADSLLDRAASRRQGRERTLFLDVPTWDGDLVCEYRILDQQSVKKMAEKQLRAIRGNGNSMDSDLEFIARAAVGLYMVDPDTGDRAAIEDEFGSVSYDRIAEKLKVEEHVDSTFKAIRFLFGNVNEDGTWEDNIVAVSEHAQNIARWMKDPSRRTIQLEDLLGE